MKKFFQKFSKFQKIAIIIAIVLLVLFGFFKITVGKENQSWTLGNALGKIEEFYKLERMKDLTVSEVNAGTDANFILAHFKDLVSLADLKNITRDDLQRIKIREARISDLPAIIEIHNKGLKKGVWCDLPYKTSAWAIIKEYQKMKDKYGEKNIYINVAEIDGKIAAVMSGAAYQGKAINLFTFVNTEMSEKLWSEVTIKIATHFFELARSLNLDVVEANIEKGVWLEGFMRDVIKAKSLPDNIWQIDRDYNLSRTWTEEDYNYDNDAVKIREEKNAAGGNSNFNNQSVDEEGGKLIGQTENSDTFKKKDGTREMLIYPSSVNIKIDGKWTKIDDYLKQPEEMSEDKAQAGTRYQLKPFEVYASADDKNKNIIKYDKDGSQISFSLESVSYKDANRNMILADAEAGNIVHSYKSAMFKDVFSGVDLKYHATKNGIKEELFFNNVDILKKVINPDYFGGKIVLRTRINVSDGVVPELLNDQIYFKKDGQNIFATSQPFIYDQEKRTSVVESALLMDGNAYYLEITMDYGWMTSDDKALPLVLDPDLNIGPTADVSLCSDSTCAVNAGVGQVFIKFNISSIPNNAIFQSASLILTHSTTYYAGTVSAQRFIDQAWNESSAVSVFTGGSFGSVLSMITTGANATETWNVLGTSSDGLAKEYNDHNTYYSIFLKNSSMTVTPTYVENGANLILNYFFVSGGKQVVSGSSDLYYSRTGTTPPVLKVTYILPVCGDGSCNGSETHATCPGDCPLNASGTNPTVFDYNNHPASAKAIFNAPGTTKTNFRK